ncbi:hypothetical protein P3T76_006264 [Phytophthora citrophthora]|uniref:Transmembrane protein n=1 Tax=Phytophthora citrophthora TaxID=4793 RepID=A0AAD9GQE9_9STRA|nr:hypothetical protein P3T76_006264 [Phytophthora citrophthora]
MAPASPTPANYGSKLSNFTPVETPEATDLSVDNDTIVEVSLRPERFIVCVAAALIASGAFLLLMASKVTLKTLTGEGPGFSQDVNDVVDNYKSISAYLQITASTIFSTFCETLIFPTLATYLHNCSLYPGDEPARVHSVMKERGIFWGLKLIIIIMNIGFTSVNINTKKPETNTLRRLGTTNELLQTLLQIDTPWAVDSDAEELHSILRTSVTGFTTPFDFQDTCSWSNIDGNDKEQQQWGAWADDVDTTSVSFSFPSRAWNTELLSSQSTKPTRSTEVPLRDYLANREKYSDTNDWDSSAAELYSVFQQGTTKQGLAGASVNSAMAPQSFEELIHVIASDLKAVLPTNTRVGDLVLHLRHYQLSEDVQFTILKVSVPVGTDNSGATLCGTSGCVYATSTSVLEQLHLHPTVSMASFGLDENSALVYSSSSQFTQEVGATQTPHEVLTLSMGKMQWQLSPLHIRHDAVCADEDELQCFGLSLPFTTGDGVLLVGKEALATDHVARSVPLVTLHPATIPDTTRPENDALTVWHRLVSSNGMLVRPSSSSSRECNSLVDAYLTHLETNHFYLDGQSPVDMVSAALFYLVQRGVPTSFADTMSRRLALMASGSGSTNTTDLVVNVPTATALITVAGCIFIILLMLCVIYLPTARVKLSPDTTPAAQYVQILTDDLYPDIVHKKRLRFANGDCLLFNEYVVDAIVVHAKRDQTKKIYL